MKTKELVLTALFMGIVFMLSLWPQVGFIALTPAINVTIVHIPVIVGGILLGKRGGLLVGIAFGVGSLINALSSPTLFAPLFINPIVSILPRALFGIVVGITYNTVKKLPVIKSKRMLQTGITAAISTLLHACMVVPLLYVFGLNNPNIASMLSSSYGLSFFLFVGGVLISNTLLEVGVATIMVPLIVRAFDTVTE